MADNRMNNSRSYRTELVIVWAGAVVLPILWLLAGAPGLRP
jgi:hypothetical protein